MKSNTNVSVLPAQVRFSRDSVWTALTLFSFLSTIMVCRSGSSNPVWYFSATIKTFKGQIQLDPTKNGEYEHVTGRGEGAPEPKEPLDEIIEKINEKYKGIFTEGDRVLLNALRDKLMADKKLKKMIRTTEPQIFTESVFPKFFNEAAQASYMESSETYKTLFADAAKYNAVFSTPRFDKTMETLIPFPPGSISSDVVRFVRPSLKSSTVTI